jgi:hypothetical protein
LIEENRIEVAEDFTDGIDEVEPVGEAAGPVVDLAWEIDAVRQEVVVADVHKRVGEHVHRQHRATSSGGVRIINLAIGRCGAEHGGSSYRRIR